MDRSLASWANLLLQELLILDEATSALDAETGQFLLQSLQELRQGGGRTLMHS